MYEYKIIRFKIESEYEKTKDKFNDILKRNAKDGWQLIQPKKIDIDVNHKEKYIEVVFRKRVYKI